MKTTREKIKMIEDEIEILESIFSHQRAGSDLLAKLILKKIERIEKLEAKAEDTDSDNSIVMNVDSNLSNGTCLQGYFPEGTTYAQLVHAFGQPNASGDDYKCDANWLGSIDGSIFTIYNYKTGKNYLGADGKETKDITTWHIGGKSKLVVDALVDHFKTVTI